MCAERSLRLHIIILDLISNAKNRRFSIFPYKREGATVIKGYKGLFSMYKPMDLYSMGKGH